MGFIQKMGDSIRRGLRSWLNITPSNPYGIQINEVMDFELSAIRNRIWYRGDGNELEQMYQQNPEYADRFKFWACRSTPGMEIRKIAHRTSGDDRSDFKQHRGGGYERLFVRESAAGSALEGDREGEQVPKEVREEPQRGPLHWGWGLQDHRRYRDQPVSDSGVVPGRPRGVCVS